MKIEDSLFQAVCRLQSQMSNAHQRIEALEATSSVIEERRSTAEIPVKNPSWEDKYEAWIKRQIHALKQSSLDNKPQIAWLTNALDEFKYLRTEDSQATKEE